MQETTIYNPVFTNTQYEYHECYECKKNINLMKYGKVKQIKYCPFCGKEIVRYGTPIFKKLPTFKWLEKYNEILEYADKKLEYEIRCKLTDEQINELIEKCNFGMEYFGSPLFWNDKYNTCKIVKDICYRKIHYTRLKKIREKFEVKNVK